MLRLLRFITPYRPTLALVLALAFLQSLANLYLPRLMADIVDVGIVQGDTGYIFRVGASMLAIAIAGTACAVVGSFFSARVATGFGRIIREQIFTHVENFSLHEFDTFSTASLITRTTNDPTQIQQVLTMILNMTITAPMMIIGGIVLAFTQDATLTLVLVAAMPFVVALFLIVMRNAIPLFQMMQVKIDKLNLILDEALGGVRVIRAFDRGAHEDRRFDLANLDLTNTAVSVNRLVAFLLPGMMLTLNLTSVAILWFGSMRVDGGYMPIGSLIAFLQYATFILFAVLMVSVMFIMLPRAAASATRINEVLDVTADITDPPQPRPAGAQQGYVEFDGVTFSYPGAEEAALEEVSFAARPGEVTAIIGGTGSGKTTLVSLIPRFYDVQRGRILVDGVDVRDMRQADLRAKIGFVPQKAVLFSGAIADNVRYGKADALPAELQHALDVAQAADFVAEMPDGPESVIAQGGINLSGGQKQRLSIARALVKRPEIYIFDDSFSALDFATDARLRAALKAETTGATVFLVSQRVGTIMDADRIIVLDEGRVVGIGKHGDLLGTCPVYREIVESQISLQEAS
ncbi:MAG: ATP-binding cassette, subfamily multidrug efflux pump [Chloroflexota bacterium]|nr:ATP-binding cassette, subfamily multidrug efflux pump [Chloroflexota bacterium]